MVSNDRVFVSILLSCNNLMMLWNFLLAFYMVYADVIREDGYHNYEGQFTVKNKGRMLRVLMSFRSVKLEECALHCVRHLRCRTYNYHHGKKDCELTDEEFYEIDLDTITHGWYNYGTPKRVNGGWSNWRDFTKCTKTCGDGTLKQYRECDSPTPAHGGADCYGKMIRRVKCNIRGCPVNGGLSDWKNSTDCSKSCGNGTMDQIRVCDSPKPEHGGANCTGKRTRTVECNTQACPVDGSFSNWKNSTDCTKSCGNGKMDQIRVCDSPKPEHGGANCTGETTRTVECNTQECPVNGDWSEWKNSTDCTKSCGSGTLKQRRDCNSPKPAYGGDDCIGIKERTVKCNTYGCAPLVVNVASGKKATQSSTRQGHSPSEAVDGDTITHSWTEYELYPWWEVDLGNVKVIKKIRLDASGYQKTNKGLLVEIRTKKDGSWNSCNNVGDVKNDITEFQCLDQITNARFVRIRSTKKCYLSLYEVEIFGY